MSNRAAQVTAEWPHLHPLLKVHERYKLVPEVLLDAVRQR